MVLYFCFTIALAPEYGKPPLLFQIHIFGDLLIYRTVFELCWVAQYILLSLYVYQSEITIGQPFVDKAASHKGIGSSLNFSII